MTNDVRSSVTLLLDNGGDIFNDLAGKVSISLGGLSERLKPR